MRKELKITVAALLAGTVSTAALAQAESGTATEDSTTYGVGSEATAGAGENLSADAGTEMTNDALQSEEDAGTDLAQGDADAMSPDAEASGNLSADGELGTELADVGADTEAGAEGSTSSDSMSTDLADSGSSATTPGQSGEDFATYGDVIASLNGNAAGSASFSDVTEESQVDWVRLSDLQGEGADQGSGLDQALTDQEDRLADIRSQIESNDVLSGALEEQGYTADQVVAWNTDADGQTTLVIDDRM
ncbi:hypothetical protein [Pelagovum pacificum]|uniref:Uncharacterized protein n=1 Tax=Pelagovum pacificum TaxID=2588711 RepID=A0A5C5GEM2_9RHOB|nr:hypothetical protein [Pelagovum pacificum]QQA43690.1 hypothetical protein I8N54_03685 [Pelagovum pacificum]TNY33178.1 hypothetical protein FHY64_07845 [Pelagovum pacificum]